MLRGKATVAAAQPRRTFVLAGMLSLGQLVIGREARLADAMARGDLHNKNEDYQAKQLQELEARLQGLRNTRPSAPRYEGHVPLWWHEKALLFGISGLRSFFHPENGMNIVQLGEAAAIPCFLESLRRTMLSDATGRRILREQPNISEPDLDMDKLAQLPTNTLGHTFYRWLRKEGVTPDTRAPVTYIDDPVHAYIFKRYRQCHDFYHAITGLPIIIEGEIAVKALEAANIGVPMAALGALLAPLRLRAAQRERLRNIYLPWAIETGLSAKPLINVYWEELLEHDVDQLRAELGIRVPPDLRLIRQEQLQRRRSFKMKYESFEN
ncbi:AGL103Wp [Eremothecium gossypii ATCC 10895]|uniref:Ubiquinone biosynthesis protein COQ4, mitochondrial n=1 Tax=Eremothecium gossypii (strain ATCC 10895 / CBS 109.51 / FGSC 9923 / NRRL Y-1056) TaxID=284811 RepID=COQ4_EREGS|nr:AGL103Wp [Eremothecium gossypii ATCC 10895]Q751B5.1 RecName: Full=Ubiquinone biosynthesis protein COQ4, mitochondrial; AltName: Full=Coenzyme Q biosynthesis protein 4 [Eremothecium gossypii ATCC 10895]AAS54388.1 AGL103Wp [Eremothecium gossypii ATCC 10895]AEY98715.1 FAGL103Wp [Eremothecium gossypii FDAG1]